MLSIARSVLGSPKVSTTAPVSSFPANIVWRVISPRNETLHSRFLCLSNGPPPPERCRARTQGGNWRHPLTPIPSLRRQRRRKRLSHVRVARERPVAANQTWAVDFIHDSLISWRHFPRVRGARSEIGRAHV